MVPGTGHMRRAAGSHGAAAGGLQVVFEWPSAGKLAERTHKTGQTRHRSAEIAMFYGPPSVAKPVRGQVPPLVPRVNCKYKAQSHHPELRFLAAHVLHCETPAVLGLCQSYK